MKKSIVDSSKKEIIYLDKNELSSYLEIIEQYAEESTDYGIALWSLCILELDCVPTDIFIDKIKKHKTSNEKTTWLWELITILVIYKHEKSRGNLSKTEKHTSCYDENSTRKFDDGLINDGLWVVILRAYNQYKPSHGNDTMDFFKNGILLLNDFEEIISAWIKGTNNEHKEIIDDEVILLRDFFKRTQVDSYPIVQKKTILLLRELANDYAEAQYVLGLLLDPEEDWLEKSSDNQFLLASFRLGYKYSIGIGTLENEVVGEDLNKSIFYFNRIKESFNNDIDRVPEDILFPMIKSSFDDLLMSSTRLLEIAHETEKKEVIQRAEIEKEREMLSYLTHTLRNSLFNGPEQLKQSIRLIGTDDYENNNRKYKAINNIISQLSTFSVIDTLITTFKQYAGDQELFLENWYKDKKGEANIDWVISFCLKQCIGRSLFFPDYQRVIKRLIKNDSSKTIKETRKSFIENILAEDGDSSVDKINEWVASYLPKIQLNIDKKSPSFSVNNTKYTYLFSIFSEIIWNSFKHIDENNPIKINWKGDGENYIFIVTNSFFESEVTLESSTNRGLIFIERLLKIFDGASMMHTKCNGNSFSVTVTIPYRIFT